MLKHIGTQEMNTARLCLRRYKMQDASDIFGNYATDERVARFLSWRPYTNIEDLQAFIAGQIAAYGPRSYNWVIEYGGQVVGSISVTGMDEKNESCEIGYCLGHAHWNKGITTEALQAVLGYLFGRVNFNRILAKHDVENMASGKVMLHCAMRQEGRLRQHYLRHDGSFSDALLYSILREEYTGV